MMPSPDGVAMPAPARQDPPREPVDYALLAEFLRALGYPARVELLDILRTPRTLSDIRLAPHRAGAGGAPAARAMARPTVLGHLQTLVDADLVRAEKVEQAGRTVPYYTVNPQKLYMLTEELRRITVQHAARAPAGEATGTLAGAPSPAAVRGPRLVLVHGVYEGRAYPLDTATGPEGEWVIGRKKGLAVALDYDPYVSNENSVVLRREGAFWIRDLAGSKNGTLVNWAPLPRGGQRRLEATDIVGVGRSLLAFAPA